MTNAAAANEYRSNIGSDYCLAAELSDWQEEEAAEQEADETAERQRVNARMAEWWGI